MVLYEGSPPAHLPLALCPHSLLSLPTSPSTLAPSPSNKQQPVAGGALGRRHWGPQSPFCFSLHTATQDLPWQPGQMEMCARREEREGKGPQRGPGTPPRGDQNPASLARVQQSKTNMLPRETPGLARAGRRIQGLRPPESSSSFGGAHTGRA